MGCNGSTQINDDQENDNPLQQQQSEEIVHDQGKKCQLIKLKICSVNFGSCQSPFQFYIQNYKDLPQQQRNSLSKQSLSQLQLNQKFQKIAQTIYKYSIRQRDLDKNLITLHRMTTKRYTPIFNQGAGIVRENFTLMDEKMFIQEWDRQFHQLYKIGNINQFLRVSWGKQAENAKAQLRKFDLICYHTLVAHIYQDDNLENVVKNNLAYKYNLVMKSKFQKPTYSKIEKNRKLEYFMEKVKIDIAFVQEVSQSNLSQIKKQFENYRVVQSKNSNSSILIRNTLFAKLEPKHKNYTLTGLNSRYLNSARFSENTKINENKVKRKQSKFLQLVQRKLKDKADHIKQSTQQKNMQQSLNKNSMLSQKSDKQQLKSQRKPQNLPPLNMLFGGAAQKQQKQGTVEKQIDKSNGSDDENASQINVADLFNMKYINKYANSISIGPNQKIKTEELKDIDFGLDSVIQFVGCLILVSVKTEDFQAKNIKAQKSQLTKFKKSIEYLRTKFPFHTLIVGIYSHLNKKHKKNQIIDQLQMFRDDEDEKKLHFVPDIYSLVEEQGEDRQYVGKKKLKRLVQKKGYYTTIYKRSNFSLNKDENNIEYMGTDCFIMSNSKINKGLVTTYNGQQINQSSELYLQRYYLPNQRHPYSNYFVYAQQQVQAKQVIFQQENEDS